MNGDALIQRLDREIAALRRRLILIEQLEATAPAWIRRGYTAEADGLADQLERRILHRAVEIGQADAAAAQAADG